MNYSRTFFPTSAAKTVTGEASTGKLFSRSDTPPKPTGGAASQRGLLSVSLPDSSTQINTLADNYHVDTDTSSPPFLRGNFTQASQFESYGVSQLEGEGNTNSRGDNRDDAESQRSDVTCASPFPQPAVSQSDPRTRGPGTPNRSIAAIPVTPVPKVAHNGRTQPTAAQSVQPRRVYNLGMFSKPPPFVPSMPSPIDSQRLSSQSSETYLPATPLSQSHPRPTIYSQFSPAPAPTGAEPKALIMRKNLENLMGEMLKQMKLAFGHLQQVRENIEVEAGKAKAILQPEKLHQAFDIFAQAHVLPYLDTLTKIAGEAMQKTADATTAKLDKLVEDQQKSQEQQTEILAQLKDLAQKLATEQQTLTDIKTDILRQERAISLEATKLRESRLKSDATLESIVLESTGHKALLGSLMKTTTDIQGRQETLDATTKEGFEVLRHMLESATSIPKETKQTTILDGENGVTSLVSSTWPPAAQQTHYAVPAHWAGSSAILPALNVAQSDYARVACNVTPWGNHQVKIEESSSLGMLYMHGSPGYRNLYRLDVPLSSGIVSHTPTVNPVQYGPSTAKGHSCSASGTDIGSGKATGWPNGAQSSRAAQSEVPLNATAPPSAKGFELELEDERWDDIRIRSGLHARAAAHGRETTKFSRLTLKKSAPATAIDQDAPEVIVVEAFEDSSMKERLPVTAVRKQVEPHQEGPVEDGLMQGRSPLPISDGRMTRLQKRKLEAILTPGGPINEDVLPVSSTTPEPAALKRRRARAVKKDSLD
ncbi:hypothetical protein SpCBS45565_g03945 [Spizellomyces sp. 'palustris']|nr:hypothetical protein SpCBS45565_g03945 [Spizellomyces sp. 'palustris']